MRRSADVTPGIRMPHVYGARFVRGQEIRSFTARGWNKDDAYVDALRQLERSGEDPRSWWYVGADRQR